LSNLPKNFFHFCLAGNVAGESAGSAARPRNLRSEVLSRSQIQIEDFDVCAFGSESRCDGSPNATSSAGDDGTLTGESGVARVLRGQVQSDTPRFQGMKSS
jgi:hypothetical protein